MNELRTNRLTASQRRAFQLVESATVSLKATGGRGVLVAGGHVVTAAHCLRWDGNGAMVLGHEGEYREEVRTANGRTLHLTVRAIEPCADIAVLGPLDNQNRPEEADEFDSWVASTRPAPLHVGDEALYGPWRSYLAAPVAGRSRKNGPPAGVRVWVYNLDRRWVPGTAMIFREQQPTVVLKTSAKIKGGASGGPVDNEAGELVAVVSNSSDGTRGTGAKSYDGVGARPLIALPVWVVGEILAAANGC